MVPLSYAYDPELDPAFSWEFISSVSYHATLPMLSMILVGSLVAIQHEERPNQCFGRRLHYNGGSQGTNSVAGDDSLCTTKCDAPGMTAVSMAVGFVLAGSLFTEVVFNYPGLGNLMLKAINARDYPLIQAILLLIVLCMLVANFVADLLLVWLDPRLRGN